LDQKPDDKGGENMHEYVSAGTDYWLFKGKGDILDQGQWPRNDLILGISRMWG